jgi:hypothetical protein
MVDLVSRTPQVSGNPAVAPGRRSHGAWLRFIALAVSLAAIVTLLVVIGQSAGAAGGCGGG